MSDDEYPVNDLFQEPEGFYEPEKPHTFQNHTTKDGQRLTVRLVGQSPLWGHHLWQAAIIISSYFESHSDEYIVGRTILELGAGAGLPSLIASLNRARFVLVTDYPDVELIQNLQYNIDHCSQLGTERAKMIQAQGFLWGADVEPLLRHLPANNPEDVSSRGFDTLILADLLFNHSCHPALLNTIASSLARKAHACALVFFTPYRPWLFDKDMAFFDLVKSDGRFVVEKLGEWMMQHVMFAQDQGDEALRRTVFGFKVSWHSEHLPRPAAA